MLYIASETIFILLLIIVQQLYDRIFLFYFLSYLKNIILIEYIALIENKNHFHFIFQINLFFKKAKKLIFNIIYMLQVNDKLLQWEKTNNSSNYFKKVN